MRAALVNGKEGGKDAEAERGKKEELHLKKKDPSNKEPRTF